MTEWRMFSVEKPPQEVDVLVWIERPMLTDGYATIGWWAPGPVDGWRVMASTQGDFDYLEEAVQVEYWAHIGKPLTTA